MTPKKKKKKMYDRHLNNVVFDMYVRTMRAEFTEVPIIRVTISRIRVELRGKTCEHCSVGPKRRTMQFHRTRTGT